MDEIHRAANTGDFVTLRRLLAEGVSVDTRSYCGLTPLHRLCIGNATSGDAEVCFRLLRDAGANLEATEGDAGAVPLHYAAAKRNNLASLLIEAGVQVNVAHSYGTTPLHDAAKKGSETTVAILVKAGAAVNVKDGWGKRPLHYARDYNPRVCHILLRAGASLVNYYYYAGTPSPFCEPTTSQYLQRVTDAGGFKEYEQAHLAKLTSTCASKFSLPAAPARLVAEFWAHAGYY